MFSLYNKGTKNYNCHCLCTFPTIKVQQLACNKICKQFFCLFLTQLTVTADRIHTSNI